ncbi:MAG: putative glycosyltransferase [Candidatus Gottesmanbacteria bacterium GW2011_GWA1_34_13]|uniref:Putative glycosyltransferase n=1 Tax=Candidatus Gottesmanbacteria bacterium GW2011_GWA1_34_13 TaxID=1618434 RepID=A0A0G0B8L0_9BACT|nr:MAG: putative glycosyltransferase [Candidatus Gottesmanbacteria bacterium GW2011_GWA1_34_13]
MIKISSVILNYNGGKDTLECLSSLISQTGKNFNHELIVVDNASSDSSVELIEKKYPQIQVIKNKTNLGYAQGNNIGILKALTNGADYVFILNNDTKSDSKCLQHLLNFSLTHKTAGIISPKIYFYPGFETHTELYKNTDIGKILWYAGGKIDWNNMLVSHRGIDEVDKGQYDEAQKTPFISGCAMFIKREVLESVGLFDSKLFLYFEDLDLCQRAKKKGYEAWYIPQAVIWHKNANSSGGSGSKLQVYYQTRNRMFIGMRYASLRTKFALFKEAGKVIFTGNEIQKKGVIDFLRNNYGQKN